MANIQVTASTLTQAVANVNRNMTVTVTLTGVGFHVYMRITRGGVRTFDVKILAGETLSFDVLRNDVVEVMACGTGSIQVTTA